MLSAFKQWNATFVTNKEDSVRIKDQLRILLKESHRIQIRRSVQPLLTFHFTLISPFHVVTKNNELKESVKRVLSVLIKYGGETRPLAFQTSSQLFALPAQATTPRTTTGTTSKATPPAPTVTASSSPDLTKQLKKSQGTKVA